MNLVEIAEQGDIFVRETADGEEPAKPSLPGKAQNGGEAVFLRGLLAK
jgi:hypothetical protein